MEKEAVVGKRYKNIKTGKIYLVLHNAVAAWDNLQSLVVYKREGEHETEKIWVRSLTEFNEKFELFA